MELASQNYGLASDDHTRPATARSHGSGPTAGPQREPQPPGATIHPLSHQWSAARTRTPPSATRTKTAPIAMRAVDPTTKAPSASTTAPGTATTAKNSRSPRSERTPAGRDDSRRKAGKASGALTSPQFGQRPPIVLVDRPQRGHGLSAPLTSAQDSIRSAIVRWRSRSPDRLPQSTRS